MQLLKEPEGWFLIPRFTLVCFHIHICTSQLNEPQLCKYLRLRKYLRQRKPQNHQRNNQKPVCFCFFPTLNIFEQLLKKKFQFLDSFKVLQCERPFSSLVIVTYEYKIYKLKESYHVKTLPLFSPAPRGSAGI